MGLAGRPERSRETQKCIKVTNAGGEFQLGKGCSYRRHGSLGVPVAGGVAIACGRPIIPLVNVGLAEKQSTKIKCRAAREY
jgi:hypothetical protein